MLIERIEKLEKTTDEIKMTMIAIPTWIPLTLEYAQELGYKTVNGLRAWCSRNLSPDEFDKKGRWWYIHKSALYKLKKKGV